jgi:Cu/Ag efflux pump CusA
MTATTAGLAILPLVIYGNLPGHEIEFPMAVVILGGLVTSTLLSLFILPALYLRFGRGTAALEDEADEEPSLKEASLTVEGHAT